ncbi:MAG: HEPN domain-containing protein [Candidatus Micrarchaeaceae archaeon]|jgi:HEPN domain-containing protein
MGRVRELIAKATKDLELAKRHKRQKEYVTATTLYNSAVEKVLMALFISKKRHEPPANATTEYLARQTGVPEEISIYINSVQENLDEQGSNEYIELEPYETSNLERSSERQAFYLDGLAQRLLDYVSIYAKI